MTDQQWKDIKAWFNHSNWKASDKLGEIGAIMLNQLPKALEIVDKYRGTPEDILEKEEKIKTLEKRCAWYELICRTKNADLIRTQRRMMGFAFGFCVAVAACAILFGALVYRA